MTADMIWWKNIVNASRYIDDIADALLNNTSIIINHSESIPWYDTMHGLVMENVKNAKKSFKMLRDSSEDPGKFIMEDSCPENMRNRYRANLMSYGKFLAESEGNGLNDKYVWISDIPSERLSKWIDFISDYLKSAKTVRKSNKDHTPGVFILDSVLPDDGIKKSPYVKVIDFNSYIDDYDINIFNTLNSSSLKRSKYFKQYLSDLAANIAEDDIELAALCTDAEEKFLRDPTATLNEIIENVCHSDGSPFTNKYSEKDFEPLVWKSQMKIVFPIYEEYRNYINNQYYQSISKYIPLNIVDKSRIVRTIGDIDDLDLGNLLFLTSQGLHIAKKDYDKLNVLKKARNKTAHFKALTYDEIAEIFSLA